ncbi:MAG: hypothetical protein U5R06_18305 [candidate division KSB1 bacterium]|nr:hypothetical protein [candidate division KSB1 bacterium]
MKIVILSGTSCVGKTPLLNALRRVYPDFHHARPLLYTSRSPRPVEQEGRDYYFRDEAQIRDLDPARYAVAKTRHIRQAVDVEALLNLRETFDYVIYDIYPTLARELMNHQLVKTAHNIVWQRIFIQPASFDDIDSVRTAMGDVSMAEALTAIQITKLVKRARNQGIELTDQVMQDINIRAQKAWEEVLWGQDYDHILVNHDGEESKHWNETPPEGGAGKTLELFYHLVTNQ